MAWRFRKSFSPLPGVRLTLSPSGISTSVGAGPFRISSGPSGVRATARIPGAGIWHEQRLGAAQPQPQVTPAEQYVTPDGMVDIVSAGSGALTTAGLAEFEKLLRRSFTEREEIGQALAPVSEQYGKKSRRVARWEKGFLFKKWFPKKLEAMREQSAELLAQKEELEEQDRLARVAPVMAIPPAVSGAHERLSLAFAAMAKSQAIWDTVGERAVNQFVERSAAARTVERRLVRFDDAPCPLLEALSPVPHMQNANGGDLFVFPAFLVYFVSRDKFALLEYSMIDLSLSLTEFLEDGTPIPSDAEQGSGTWLKVNKNGSPDMRFKDNRRIPTAIYGKLLFTSSQGLREEYMVSNRRSAEEFAGTWSRLVDAVRAGK
jgi:hypothetical protein